MRCALWARLRPLAALHVLAPPGARFAHLGTTAEYAKFFDNERYANLLVQLYYEAKAAGRLRPACCAPAAACGTA